MKEKDINEEKLKEKLIRELGVFELRGLARQMGVTSPTTKKREELISLIMDAVHRGVTLEKENPKRGRPYKRLNILNSLTSQIAPETTDLESFDFNSIATSFQFNQEVNFDLDEFDNIKTLEGIFREINDGGVMYDINTNAKVIFGNDLNTSKLSTGDKIVVEAKEHYHDNKLLATRIISINGCDPYNYKSSWAGKAEAVIDERGIPFDKGEAKIGRRNAYLLEGDIYEHSYYEDFYKFCQENGYELITLGANISYENQIRFNSLNIKNNFTTLYGTKAQINFNKIIDAIYYSQNLLERGKNVVLFIVDIGEIIRSLDENFNNEVVDNEDEHALKTKVVIQKLMEFARSYKENGSGTLIMCYNQSDLEDKYILNNVLRICKKI